LNHTLLTGKHGVMVWDGFDGNRQAGVTDHQ
jgi:hypothetical protein